MTITTGTRDTFTDTGSDILNVDDRLDFLTPTDLPLLSYLGFAKDAGGATSGANTLKFPCINTTHTWLNDDLVPSTSAVTVAYTAAGGTISVANGESERFQANDLIYIGTSYFLITAVDHAANTLTVTELFNSADHAVGDVIYLSGNAQVEATLASSITSRTTDFGSTSNYSQIFMAVVRMGGSEMAVERYGISGDPYEYQVNKRLKEIAIQLEKAALYGRRNSSYPSTNATARYMGGIAEYVRDGSGTNVTDAAGADLDEILLNDMLQDIWADGGAPDTIMVGGRQKRMISSFLNPYVRVQRSETVSGVVVGSYVSDFGELDVVLNRWMKPDDCVILTREFIGIGPLAGNGNSRSFFSEKLPRDGDREQTQVIGEYTEEVRNATKAHGWIYGLSTS